MSFYEIYKDYVWEEVRQQIEATTPSDVARSLAKSKRDIRDFIHLISPAARPFLEEMAQLSQQLTHKRFGKTIQLYTPMYLSNECHNICTYCGFSMDNKIRRKTLAPPEIKQEIQLLKSQGYDHILLVTGEANHTVHMPYFEDAIKQIRPHFSTISIEVQPLEEKDYIALAQLGVYAVLVYQETYHEAVYKRYHPKGKKSNFRYRLETADRIGQAGIHKIGLGVLLGLEDWRVDSFFTALHLDYLQKKYWKTKYAISFPRLRPAEGNVEPNFIMEDIDLLQLMFAYRIWNEDIELSISTRESEHFRNHVIGLGVTSMSAGSKTNPGGYSVDQESLAQFEICDNRSTEVIHRLIQSKGYEPVWTDWHASFANYLLQ
ncbi:2-iminoacetate synthase ThiH [Myroides sp. DF42-4-2]|uniref:2-iminoacetate synthase ThiH n=1 Tax=unclassified Myroides TaxID=2642485 RepID=UPI002576F18F|nr:2-iminoacetate synthase ThiH [Myroides sp. DF42-4-2]MDM1407164.1 2-iminoacetate synthase ThiH [Myroides sp. DF42-4-2]